jgi:hypothetical protein
LVRSWRRLGVDNALSADVTAGPATSTGFTVTMWLVSS